MPSPRDPDACAAPLDRAPASFRSPRASRPGAGWIHELKYDGYRLHLRLEDGAVRLLTRRGHDWAERMPALVRAAETLAAAETPTWTASW